MPNSSSIPADATWKATSIVAGLAGSMIARKVASTIFTNFSSADVEPPLNPADRRVTWTSAMTWAIAAGVGAGIGKLVSQRGAAAGWEAATGTTPPTVAA